MFLLTALAEKEGVKLDYDHFFGYKFDRVLNLPPQGNVEGNCGFHVLKLATLQVR